MEAQVRQRRKGNRRESELSNSEVQAIMLILVAFIPLVGLTMALTPRLQPRGEVFSVSVPTSAWDDPRVRRLMNRYVAIVIVATALFTVAALALCLMGNAEASLAVVVVASLALLAIGYGLILRYRAKVQGLKRACGLGMALAMIGIVSMGAAVAIIIGVALLCVVGSLIVGVKYGQSGSRVFRMEASDTLLSDDDRFWKLGMLYCNPDDASLFLPQRSGIGWTVNWGRPAVWAMVAAFVLLVAAFIAICVVMVR